MSKVQANIRSSDRAWKNTKLWLTYRDNIPNVFYIASGGKPMLICIIGRQIEITILEIMYIYYTLFLIVGRPHIWKVARVWWGLPVLTIKSPTPCCWRNPGPPTKQPSSVLDDQSSLSLCFLYLSRSIDRSGHIVLGFIVRKQPYCVKSHTLSVSNVTMHKGIKWSLLAHRQQGRTTPRDEQRVWITGCCPEIFLSIE